MEDCRLNLSEQSRTPLGVRELKLRTSHFHYKLFRRTPLGVRELKLFVGDYVKITDRRTPLGVRELK